MKIDSLYLKCFDINLIRRTGLENDKCNKQKETN